MPEFFEHREKFMHPADFLDLIARQPKVGKPGERWSYSNAGFILLGRIVETASGQAYEDYIQRHVFAPAGMTTTGFDRLEDVTPKLAVGYFKDDVFGLTPWKANWEWLPYHAMPAGGGYSTNADLLRFAAALRARPAGQAGDAARRCSTAKWTANRGQAYATGFDDSAFAGRHLRGHNGQAPGMSADLAIVWETGSAVAVTSNTDGPTATDFADHVAKLLAVQ